MTQKSLYIPFQSDPHVPTETPAEKAKLARAMLMKIAMVTEGRARIYDVTTPEGKVYRTVANSNGKVSCNCKCGMHMTNSNCAHALRTRITERERNLQVLNVTPASNYFNDEPDIQTGSDEYIF